MTVNMSCYVRTPIFINLSLAFQKEYTLFGNGSVPIMW